MYARKTARAARLVLIDASNVVRRAHGYGGPDFRAQEDADAAGLVESLAILCESRQGRLEVDLVFDGAARPSAAGLPSNLRVRFAREDSADELILDRVRYASHSGHGRALVVTGDGELGARAETEGGRWLAWRGGEGLGGLLRALERAAR